jgi:hypothetical protein
MRSQEKAAMTHRSMGVYAQADGGSGAPASGRAVAGSEEGGAGGITRGSMIGRTFRAIFESVELAHH